MHRVAKHIAADVSPQAVPVASCRKDPDPSWLLRPAAVRNGRGPRPVPSHSSLPTILLILLGSLLMGTRGQSQEAQDLPKNIRVIVEYIEVPHEVLTEVMRSEHADSGPKLHARMRALMKEGKAKVLETSILTTCSGQRASASSIMEHIYPTEYEPPTLPGSFSSEPGKIADPRDRDKHARPQCPTAFDMRHVGVTLEIDPALGQNEKLIDLRFGPELVDLLRYETCSEYHDQWGDASSRHPIYESLRISAAVVLEDGKFGFVGLLTPRNDQGGRDTTRKVMLFVRADIITIGP